MVRALRILFGTALIAYLGLCATLFFFQRSLIYFPQPNSGSGGATTITLPAGTERVLVSTRPKEGPLALIYFGGNAEDVSFAMPSLSGAFPSHAIYLMHYRGYGGSSGSPSEKALFADALTLFDKVHDEHPKIEIIGRSLGSGIAVYVASRRPVARLVLVTPYDSLEELAELQYPYIPVKWLLIDKFESSKFAPHVTAPTLIIAAQHDEIIPRESTELLVSRFSRARVSYRVVAEAGHNTISGSPEYMALLKDPP
jgi:hypothetical protein